MRSKIAIPLVVVLIAALLVGFYFYKHHKNVEKLTDKGPKKPVIVSLATVKKVTLSQQVTSVGSINSRIGIMIRAQVPGRVVQINYLSGRVVKKGKVMFVIYPYILEAELRQAKAQLELSEYNYRQYTILQKEKAVSYQRMLRAKSQMDLDRAKIKAIEERLELTKSVAPFDGIVGLTQINLNDYVKTGDVLATFQALDKLRVDFSVPQDYCKSVKLGDKVSIRTEVSGSKEFYGKIYAINPLVNRQTRMLDLRADISGENIMPGMFADVTLYFGKKRQALMVPQTAVVTSLHGDYVYKVTKQVPKKVFVKVGDRRGNMVEITEGLKAGDVVVSAGQIKIHKGDKVTDKNALIVKENYRNYDGP